MKLLFPDDARAWLQRRYSNQRRQWIAGQSSWPLTLALGEPNERRVVEDATLIRTWIEAWRQWQGPGDVAWEERRWPRVGVQQLPARLVLQSPLDVAHVLGEAAMFMLAHGRYEAIAQRWSVLRDSSALARNAGLLAEYTEPDFERLIALIDWIEQNPRSDLYLRQLPIPGMHTKWIDAGRRGVISELIGALRGEAGGADFHELCGLRRAPVRLRMRVLCSRLRNQLGGLGDVEAPLEELAALTLQPSCVVIVENLETGIALPQLSGCVAFMKLGMGVSLLGQLTWLRDLPALYWGDIDTHGYAILDRARVALPLTRSVLMDEATLLAHRDLCVREAVPHPDVSLPRLTLAERAVFEGLRAHRWGHALRLEQERIPWTAVLPVLHAATALGR
jgi:hypothetical protein